MNFCNDAGLMRAQRIEPHPKVAGQALGTVLQTVVPRLQDKQLKTDAIQNTENAIADLVSKGELFAGIAPNHHGPSHRSHNSNPLLLNGLMSHIWLPTTTPKI